MGVQVHGSVIVCVVWCECVCVCARACALVPGHNVGWELNANLEPGTRRCDALRRKRIDGLDQRPRRHPKDIAFASRGGICAARSRTGAVACRRVVAEALR